MSITAKTSIVLVALFLAMLGGAWVILEQGVRPTFLRQEQAQHDADLARLRNNVAAIGRDMRARVLDYARWDETYAFVQGRNASYVAQNFSDEWFSSYGADLVIFADDRGHLLWSQQRGVYAGLESAGIAGAIIEQARAHAPQRSAPIEGVIWTADGPMLFGAARATRSDGGGAPKGLVIIGRHLNGGALAEQVQLDLRFVPTSRVPPNLAPMFTALRSSRSQSWTTEDTRFALLPLKGADGLLAGAVLAQRTRDLAALGQSTVTATLLMLTALFACLMGALWFLLQRTVISRVVRLERHFHDQDEVVTPAEHDETPDEIGSLTRAYNALSQRLASALKAERQATAAREIEAASNKMKSDFLANISHELRTPLNDVIGYAELIEEDLSDAGFTRSQDDLKRIGDAARHLLALTNEILDLSRIEAERLDVRCESFRIDELLRSAVDTASVLARAQSSLLRVECDSDLGSAYSDQGRWRQCLVNVLAYACKRTHSGVVRLRAERRPTPDGEMLRFEIVDQGAPLNQSQITALFEPFVRGETHQANGARLGLSVTRKLASMLGGSIDIHTQPRRGCVFVLMLKAKLDPDALANSAAA